VTEVGGGRVPGPRARIDRLLDPGSFTELDGLAGAVASGDAPVVAGAGAIDGRDVAVYGVDPTRLDEAAARKVVKVQDLALRSRIPIVGILQPAGPPIHLGVAALAGHAGVLERNVRSSGVIPQLSVVLGPLAAEALYSAALTDLVLSTAGQLGDEAHLVVPDEAECWRAVRALLSYLPAHSGEPPPFRPASDPAHRADPELQALAAPDSPRDALEIVSNVLDDGRFLEIRPLGASDVLIGFGRLGGHPVGVVANRHAPAVPPAGVDAATRAARFVRLCDGFHIPVISLVDTPGGTSAGDALLLHACAAATVPRLTVVTGRARGGAFALASSRQMGADLCLAWPAAAIAAADPYAAAERGFVDAVIEPADTRRLLIRGLELCLGRAGDPGDQIPLVLPRGGRGTLRSTGGSD
jgi:acetyl-CoA carboxylase carboxyltransferase component